MMEIRLNKRCPVSGNIQIVFFSNYFLCLCNYSIVLKFSAVLYSSLRLPFVTQYLFVTIFIRVIFRDLFFNIGLALSDAAFYFIAFYGAEDAPSFYSFRLLSNAKVFRFILFSTF